MSNLDNLVTNLHQKLQLKRGGA